MSSKIFLDTTIQIERISATDIRQKEIADVLHNNYVVTSNYVLGEYLRTFVKDAAILYELVNTTGQMPDVEVKMANMFSKRTLSRCLLIWAMLHRSGIYQRDMILSKLEAYLQYGLINRFMTGIDEFIDTTHCGLAQERPTLVSGTYQLRTQCTRPVKECELAALLTKHKTDVQILADGLKNYPDGSLARMGELCTMILEEPDVARGRNCTWYLGDLVIALEAPMDAAIYTTNRKHFEPICALLGKEVYGAE